MEVCMIILKENDLCVVCDCGLKFVATDGDFKLNQFTRKLFTECPSCGESHYIIPIEFDTEKSEIEGEKCEID